MDNKKPSIAIALGTAILGGLGVAGYRLASAKAAARRRVSVANESDPATVIAARNVA